MMMPKFLHDILTEPDNETFCIIKTIAAVGTFSFISLSITHVLLSHTFDYIGFGTGLGAIMGSAGVGAHFKKDSPIDDHN
jgi:hypothetical protein